MPEWCPQLGAIHDDGATTFRVWAPEHGRIDLVIEADARRLTAADPSEPLATSSADVMTRSMRAGGAAVTDATAVTDAPSAAAADAGQSVHTLTRDARGYWHGRLEHVAPGTRYRFRIDGDAARTFPDPASRFQPTGVHGVSQVVDPRAFRWTDEKWRPPSFESLVIYELHVGTFTPEGTFRAASERLPYLRDLGITAIELMPLADFAGDRNWGYDGVALFAPARCYGTPDDLRALVDAAHGHGLAVLLDVVYNHLGPEGAYANAFSSYYFTDAHCSPWGRGVNLDGPHSDEVRRFFIENALHWVREYHVDGLRLDATHALKDESRPHFLQELTSTLRAEAGRTVYFIAEDHRNLATLVTPADRGGMGVDGVWADDFHHQARVHTAGDREGYYADFSGTIDDLAATLQRGWFFSGQYSSYLREHRGTDPGGLSPRQFVICIQNHDQIGNRADGARLNHHVDEATFRALTTLLLLAPQTPLLFMGQEWGAGAPFLYFTDHPEELGRQVTEGRRAEFGSFAAFADAEARARIPDPQAASTFTRSRLDWGELTLPTHRAMLRLYQRLLALRRTLPVPPFSDAYRAEALDRSTLALTFAPIPGDGEQRRSTVVVVRLSGSGTVTVPTGDAAPQLVMSTEDDDVAIDPQAIDLASAGGVTVAFRRPGAVVFAAFAAGR